MQSLHKTNFYLKGKDWKMSLKEANKRLLSHISAAVFLWYLILFFLIPASFSLVTFPHLAGSAPSWSSLMDSSKQWDYYARREKDRERDRDRSRDRDRDRDRDRERTRDRERDRDHSPSSSAFNRSVQRLKHAAALF